LSELCKMGRETVKRLIDILIAVILAGLAVGMWTLVWILWRAV